MQSLLNQIGSFISQEEDFSNQFDDPVTGLSPNRRPKGLGLKVPAVRTFEIPDENANSATFKPSNLVDIGSHIKLNKMKSVLVQSQDKQISPVKIEPNGISFANLDAFLE